MTGQEREALTPDEVEAAFAAFWDGHRSTLPINSLARIEAALSAALAAREEPRLCHHSGPDGASCELPSGHDRLHLQRLERGYVEWER